MDAQEESQDTGLPVLRLEERTCRTCKYFEFEGDDRANAASGECRRNSPDPGSVSKGYAHWPRVRWDNWCGEWGEGISYEEMLRMARNAGAH